MLDVRRHRNAVPLALLLLTACRTSPTPAAEAALLTERAQRGGYEIFQILPDGTEVILSNDPADATQPKWASRSGRIAFVSTRDGNPEIYRMGPTGGGILRLTDHPAQDLHPAWSPDARWIAFTSDRDGDMEIYRMRTQGESLTQLTDNSAADAEADWSGTTIVFTSNRTGDWELYTMAQEGGTETQLFDRPDWDDVDPVWSPDGTMIAFESVSRRTDRPANTDLFVWKVAEELLVRVTDTDDRHEIDPAWSQDGTELAFATFDSANTNLDIHTINVERLVEDPPGTGVILPFSTVSWDERSPAWCDPPSEE